MRAIASSRKLVDLGPARTADQPVWERERKAPATERGGAGLDRKTDGRSTTEERERGETRAREAPSKLKGAVAAATDPSRPVRRAP